MQPNKKPEEVKRATFLLRLFSLAVSLWCFMGKSYAAHLDTGKINAACLPLRNKMNPSPVTQKAD